METGPLSALCLPTWKSPTGPPNYSTAAPPGLDHFACYPLTPIAGDYHFVIPARVLLQDQFMPNFTSFNIQQNAKFLCASTTKFAYGRTYSPANPTDLSLTCFFFIQAGPGPAVIDQNQFGQGPIQPGYTQRWLCLPTKILHVS